VTDSIDRWSTIPDHNVHSDYTYSLVPHPETDATIPGRSIFDRAASSRMGTAAVTVEALPTFISCTDHREILTSTTLIPSLNGLPVLPDDSPPSTYAPRFRHPPSSESCRLTQFSTLVDEFLANCSHKSAQLPDDENFEQLYQILSLAFSHSASQAFQYPLRENRRSTKPTNPTIHLIVKERKRVDQLLSAINQDQNVILPPQQFTYSYPNAFYSSYSAPNNTYHHFRAYLRNLRRTLQKVCYAEERAECIARQSRSAGARVRNLLHGGSPKTFYPNKITALPIALVPPPFSDPNILLAG
jgi:hypothetical protein